jgi:hypothetical protein
MSFEGDGWTPSKDLNHGRLEIRLPRLFCRLRDVETVFVGHRECDSLVTPGERYRANGGNGGHVGTRIRTRVPIERLGSSVRVAQPVLQAPATDGNVGPGRVDPRFGG